MNPTQAVIFEDTSAALMARLLDDTDAAVVTADITSIAYSVYDLDSATPGTAIKTGVLVPAAVIFDAYVTGNGWTLDATGYNFRTTLDATHFPTAGHRHLVEVWFTPASGSNFVAPFEVLTEPTRADADTVTTIVGIDDVLQMLGITRTDMGLTDYATLMLCWRKAMGVVKSFLCYDPVQAAATEFYPLSAGSGVASGEWTRNADGTMAVPEYVGGEESEELFLRRIPIRSIASIYEDTSALFGDAANAFAAASLLTVGTDYFTAWDQVGLCMSGLVYRYGSWPGMPGSIKVTYTAGFSDTELAGNSSVVDASPIRIAAILQTMKLFATAKARAKNSAAGFIAGTPTSEKLGDYSYTLEAASAALLSSMQASLAPEITDLLQPFRHPIGLL